MCAKLGQVLGRYVRLPRMKKPSLFSRPLVTTHSAMRAPITLYLLFDDAESSD